jgi:magnesium transporter
MKDRNYIEEIKDIVSGNNPSLKKELLEDYHESDIADVVEELTKEERIALYEILGDKRTALVFSYLENVDEYVSELEYADAADIIEQMDADDAVDVLEELEEEDADKIINLMDDEIIEDINLIQSYEDDEIGSKMTTNFIAVEYGSNVKQTMSALINQAAENDNVSTIFVIENDKFYGTIELRDLIIARSNQNMDYIIKTSYPRVYAKTLIEDCISDLSDYQLDSIPVLDADDKLLGVITLADIVETVEEELTEDYARLGGVSEEEEISTGIFKTVWMRLPWLIALLFLSLLVSVLLSSFESVISVLPAIVFFQSMILGMAGNGGTQSLAVTIRTISDDNDDKTLIKAILKEIRVGFINGLALGALSFVVILAFLVLKQQEIIQNAGYNFDDALKAAMIVGSSLIVAMTFASLVGSVVPILLSKLKIDPAVASGPFITTINDILAILIYYGLAFVLFISVF